MKIFKHETLVKTTLIPYFLALVYCYKQELNDYSKKKINKKINSFTT